MHHRIGIVLLTAFVGAVSLPACDDDSDSTAPNNGSGGSTASDAGPDSDASAGGTGGAAGSGGSVVDASAGGKGGAAGAAGGGGSSEADACPSLGCAPACGDAGVAIDENGCPTCECNPLPDSGPDCNPGSTTTNATLEAELGHLDLDTGTITDCGIGPSCPDGWDVKIAWNGVSQQGAVFHNQSAGREVAVVSGIPYAMVTTCDAAAATYSTALMTGLFTADKVVLVKTDLGAVFKLGNPMPKTEPNKLPFSFDYARLQ